MSEERVMPISEIFYSIDGEGSRTGSPAIFIRSFGCNLDCSYCDSVYACKAIESPTPYRIMSVDEIVLAAESFAPCKCVTLTGGEPLIQKNAAELVSKLRDAGFWVNIETNGSIDLAEFKSELTNPDKKSAMDYFFTMDWKSISSGESDKMLASNLSILDTNDVLKFVVGTEEDLDQMRKVLEDNPELDAQIYVSPVWGQIEPEKIVHYLLQNRLVYVKVQVQLHKIIWDCNKRGV